MEKYDVIIIGGGPAGLTAAIYTGRANLHTLIIEKENFGSLVWAHKIENYPGFIDGISGQELYELMKNQAKRFNVEFLNANFLELDVMNDSKIVKTDKRNFKADSVIIAMGKGNNNSKIIGEQEFIGRGVSYCATCDGAFYKGKTVSVFGNGDEAVEEALSLTAHANKIYFFVNSDKLECEIELMNSMKNSKKIEIIPNTEIQSITGKDFVEKVSVKQNGEIKSYETEAAFLFLGTKSKSDMFSMIADLDDKGFITTEDNMRTFIDGVYAAGDIRHKEVRQVTTATSDGTIAGMDCIKYLLKNKK